MGYYEPPILHTKLAYDENLKWMGQALVIGVNSIDKYT